MTSGVISSLIYGGGIKYIKFVQPSNFNNSYPPFAYNDNIAIRLLFIFITKK